MIHWSYKHYKDLTTDELYQILSLRSSVFIVEQNCVYQDLDNKDRESWHLCGLLNNVLVAYARILPPGLSYSAASIGRVITHPNYRREGYGIALMTLAIEKTKKQFETDTIKIGAQCYLINFYASFGFAISSAEYIEDGILHIEMTLGPSS